MLDTYMKNRGSAKTLIYDNNHNNINEINWDVDYDGKVANISLETQNNGKKKHYDVTLDNEDLANILNVPSVTLPLEKRLKSDFKKQSIKNKNIYKIEFENIKSPPLMPIVQYKKNEQTVEELLESIKSHQPHKSLHISSPMPNEEFIIPLTLNNKSIDKYTLTPKRRHRKNRTHKIYKVYKKHKPNKKSRRH
jgi:hypothetical protein